MYFRSFFGNPPVLVVVHLGVYLVDVRKVQNTEFSVRAEAQGACFSLMYFFESGSPFAIMLPPMFDIEIIYSFGHSVNILVTFSQNR